MPRREIPDLPPHLQAALDSLTPEQLRDLLAQAGLGRPASPEPTLLPRRAEAVTYRVRVELDEVEPPVWRRLEVASDLDLDAFHEVLQAAMGWTDSHLHAFTRLGTPAGHDEPAFLTAVDVAEGDEGTAEAEVRLDEVLAEPGDRLRYTYDFGDGWHHVVDLEEVLPRTAGQPAARCVAGERACPPEDSGGPWNYPRLVELLARHRAGGPVDDDLRDLVDAHLHHRPEDFSVDEANAALADAVGRGTGPR